MSFLMALIVILIIIFFAFPQKGLELCGIEISFLSKEDFLETASNTNSNKISLINLDSITKLEQQKRDSLKGIEIQRLKDFKDSVLKAEKRIQYPSNDISILFPFFNKLQNATSKKVRIMHYGDSQIEADRISGRLRETLQKQFGGNGAGAYALIPATRKISIKNKVSNNWKRYTGFGPYIDKSVIHDNYGALFSFCKIIEDTTATDSSSKFNGILKVYRPKKAYKHCRNYQQLNIFYTSSQTVNIKYTINDTILSDDTLAKSNIIAKKTILVNKAPESLEIQFKSSISPLFYGISVEGLNGVVVDNIPLRGASGTEFAKISFKGLQKMHELLDPSLFILEFGGNAIAHIKTDEGAERYGRKFKRQINKIKKINPKAVVLVIGPGDMAKKEKTNLVSFPYLEKVRDELKKAAFETNSCFWDMYLNMGGENSIIDWANKSPSLAAKDYIHLTNAGARKVSDLFIEDLMVDYKNFIKISNEKKN
tara:strand:- start:19242 stop:20687 length:1446 start_codon:yes stop_codon:yes gene_type:complete